MKYRRVVISRRGGPEVLQVIEETLPEPRPHEVRVKVLTAGVAFADLGMREGVYPGKTPPIPFTPGYDIYGIVDQVGSEVVAPAIGEPVVALTMVGGYAEYVCVPADILVQAPTGLDPAQAVSLVLNYLSAYQMLHRIARVQSGENILIHGAGGGTGTALLELGKLSGLKMYGTASPGKHAIVRQLGGIPIDYTGKDFVSVLQHEAPAGMDAVFDPIGGEHCRRSYKTLRAGGRLVSYGFSTAFTRGRLNVLWAILGLLQMPRYSLTRLFQDNKSVAGYFIQNLVAQRPDWYRADLSLLVNMLAEGKLSPIVAEQLPLQEAAWAHELLGQSRTIGKVVLLCQER